MSWVIVVVVFGALGLGGCQSARSVIPIPLPPAGLVLPTDARLLATHDAAVRGIAAMMVRDFGLPVPDQVTVYVYGSRRVFEEGLVRDAHLSPARAAELSGYAIGVGRPRQLLFHDVDSVTRRREIARGGVGRSVALAAARLDLEALGSPAGFTAYHRSAGSVPTYQLAFLMVDHLIERGGFGRVIDYFRAFTVDGDSHRNFEHVFGQTLGAFEREILDDLATPRP